MKNNKILIIDKDKNIFDFIKNGFNKSNKNISLLYCDKSNAGIELAWQKKPTIIIIENNMSVINGLQIIGILKKNNLTQNIFSIILHDILQDYETILNAFKIGADDCIYKYISKEILIAKINRILENINKYKNNDSEKEEIAITGNILVNVTTHNAYLGTKRIELTPKEFALLYLFVKQKNKVMNRLFLSNTIWEQDYSKTNKSIDKHIANLRKKLKYEGKRIITIPKVGYKFVEY